MARNGHKWSFIRNFHIESVFMYEYRIYPTLMTTQDDDFLGPEFDQEKSGTADNLTPKQTHVFDWDKSIILDDIDEKPEAAVNANSSSKDQYCVLSGE